MTVFEVPRITVPKSSIIVHDSSILCTDNGILCNLMIIVLSTSFDFWNVIILRCNHTVAACKLLYNVDENSFYDRYTKRYGL